MPIILTNVAVPDERTTGRRQLETLAAELEADSMEVRSQARRHRLDPTHIAAGRDVRFSVGPLSQMSDRTRPLATSVGAKNSRNQTLKIATGISDACRKNRMQSGVSGQPREDTESDRRS